MMQSTWRLVSLLTLLAAAALAGCGGGGSSPAPPTGLQLSYDYVLPSGTLPFTARVGDVVGLKAFGTYTGGAQPITLTSQVTWASSVPAVASVSATGVLTAKSAGATHISISYQSLTPVGVDVTVEDVGSLPTATYYPFVQGNVWTYTGTAVAPSSVRPAANTTLTITCVRQVIILGQVWWEVQIQGTDTSTPPSNLWLRHEAGGLTEYLDSSHNAWRLKTPLQVGTTWTDPDDSDHAWQILSMDESVTVPANTNPYHCLKAVEHWVTSGTPAIPYDITTWYAPNVGVVQSITSWNDPSTGDPLTDEQKLTHAELH